MNTYLVITPFFPSSNSFRGGYVFDQINQIKKQTSAKIFVIVLKSLYEKQNDPYLYKGILCLPFTVLDFPSFIFPGIFQKINNYRLKLFLKKHKIKNVDVVHVHVNYPAAHLGIFLKTIYTKSVFLVQHHGLDIYQSLNGRFRFLFRFFQNHFFIKKSTKILSKYDYNIGVSSLVLKQLGEEFLNQNKTIVLYNGVDRNKFFNYKIKKSDIFTIGCVGNFLEIKNQKILIESCIHILEKGLDLELKLVGTGLYLEKCKDLIPEKYKEKFLFLKEMEHDKLNEFYNLIDVFVLPSYYEAFGCVYIESWATNTPFIAVQGQGIEEVMTQEMRRELLIDASNKIDLVNKIMNIYNKEIREIKFDTSLTIDNTIRKFLSEIN